MDLVPLTCKDKLAYSQKKSLYFYSRKPNNDFKLISLLFQNWIAFQYLLSEKHNRKTSKAQPIKPRLTGLAIWDSDPLLISDL